jgi:hypothetical protein
MRHVVAHRMLKQETTYKLLHVILEGSTGSNNREQNAQSDGQNQWKTLEIDCEGVDHSNLKSDRFSIIPKNDISDGEIQNNPDGTFLKLRRIKLNTRSEVESQEGSIYLKQTAFFVS